MPPIYYRAIPARGTHPGVYEDTELPADHPLAGRRFEHDPRGYHPDWQRGWQEGYTYGFREWAYGGHIPRDVDEEQWKDGFTNGSQVGAYQGAQVRYLRTGAPSPWWRDPRAEQPQGYQHWTVLITVPTVPGSTARDAAARAWEAVTCDRPPIVEVYPETGSPADAVTIDLSEADEHDEQEETAR